ncbi:hypothetical protein C2W62_45310 [Candidatus Entotheonella serta]|nr:hypothetical protein C2W62_45310 [Candidatus Entotheonella serta]
MTWDWLQALENAIVNQWEREGKAPEAFPEICQQALTSVSLPMDRDTFLRELLHLDYPTQGYHPRNEFGDVAVTMARNPDFRIDAYMWNGGRDTSIHDHHFMGAYRPIFGRSRELSFTFEPQCNIDKVLTQGQLTHRETLLLEIGEARAIPLGEALIHLVEHVDTPTITICVRTYDVPGHQLQQYFFPGYRLAYGQFRVTSQKKLNLLHVMSQAQLPDGELQIEPVLEALTPSECFALFTQSHIYITRFQSSFKDRLSRAVREHVMRFYPAWLFVPLQNQSTINDLISLDKL